MSRIRGAGQVLVKPNLVTDKPEYIALGANTSVEVLEALLRILSDAGCRALIAESETGTPVKGRRLEITWNLMGLPEVAQRYGATLLNLTHLPKRKVPFERLGLGSLELPEALFECGLILNIPKIKTHKYAVLTCAMKNLFGLVPEPRRVIYHRWLHEIIAELACLLDSKMVTVVDGLIGMEGNGPLYGKAVHLNLILAGASCYAIDQTVCDLIGVDPDSVPYLIRARSLGLDPGPFEVSGDSLPECRRVFQPVEFSLYRLFEKKLMESPLVNVVTAPWFQRHISRRVSRLTEKLRGGGYSWYPE
jgi:uncharacterized protein (DUF362 family)